MKLLLPYQSRWIRDRSNLKIWSKSRRIGASFCEALNSVLEAAIYPKPRSTIYISYNKDSTRDFIEDCAKWARALDLAVKLFDESIIDDDGKDVLTYELRFKNGKSIRALSGRPTNIRGKQSRVTLDESGFVEDLAALLKAAIALQIWGSQLSLLSSHNGEDNLFNQLVQGARAKENEYSLHETTIDDAIADGLYKRICQVSGGEWSLELQSIWRSELFRQYGAAADEELLCKASGESRSLFNLEKVAECAIGKWQPPKSGHRYLLCVDPNFGAIGNDFYVCQVWDITKIPVALAYEYRNNTNGSEHHRSKSLNAIDAYKPVVAVFEGNGGGKPMAERIQSDRPRLAVEVVNTGRLSKVQNSDRVALMVEQGECIFPSDWAGVAEMRKFSAKERQALSGHDDSTMCFATGMALLTEFFKVPRRYSGGASAGAGSGERSVYRTIADL